MRLLLVDDHPLITLGFGKLIDERPGWRLFNASNAAAGIEQFCEQVPDVTILGFNSADNAKFDLLQRILELGGDARLLVLGDVEDAALAARVLRAGAKGFAAKNDLPQALILAIETVQQGGTWLSASLIQDVAHLRSRGTQADCCLTPREEEILRRLAYGESMNELSWSLDVSYKTISKDCASLRERLGAKTLPEMVRIGLQRRLIS
ncbi:MAG: response regulator transcription factor [Alphaproteobacteria bacterium]|nr:response regulator transcription factor [Alphaproteobacteria bacterium]